MKSKSSVSILPCTDNSIVPAAEARLSDQPQTKRIKSHGRSRGAAVQLAGRPDCCAKQAEELHGSSASNKTGSPTTAAKQTAFQSFGRGSQRWRCSENPQPPCASEQEAAARHSSTSEYHDCFSYRACCRDASGFARAPAAPLAQDLRTEAEADADADVTTAEANTAAKL